MPKRVLITGGSGYLARGGMRRVSGGDPDWELTCYSRGEEHQELARRRYPDVRYVLGDVRDVERLSLAMLGHDYVIHAAALKFVDRAETNAAECFSNNIGGAQSVITAARAAGIERVVGISTDKAVQPVNAYGASKMVMERLFSEASGDTTRFTCVRYGNVVGSTGSVIPLFKYQFASSGQVFVTDPSMTRFWMGVDEAIDLIVAALADDVPPGAIVIPIVKAMRMKDVVLAAVGDVPVEIVGVRPGEKLHERLLHLEESVRVVQRARDFILLPPGEGGQGTPQTFTSQNPHHWMPVEEMRELIADAETI